MQNAEQHNISNATEERFNQSYYSDTLTAFAAGWKDPESVESLLEFVAPSVPVSRRFEYKQTDTDAVFYSEQDDIRAIGSDFKRIEFVGKSVQAKTFNKGLTVRVDHDETMEESWAERYVHLLMKRLYRNELRRALAAIDLHDTETKFEWTNESSPDTDIRNTLLAASGPGGYYPNRIIFGEMAWLKRFDSYGAQNNARANVAADLDRGELADKLFVDEIRLLKKHQLGPQVAEWNGNEIYAFYAKNGLLKDEPSNIKRFSTPISNNCFFRVYLEDHTKYTDLTVEHYSNIVITSTKGISKLIIG